MRWFKAALITIAAFVAFDLLIAKPILGLGYPTHYQQDNVQRLPAPYIEFSGKPNAADHDKWGYRWVHQPAHGDIAVSFFGGSTGYQGEPPIPTLMEGELTKALNRPVAVSNFSVVSSNHRQHLHNIIESRSIVKPDLVVFYGGYNETLQSAYYDPRPGYPYNFFFRDETPPAIQALLRYSAFAGMLDEALQRYLHRSLTPIERLRAQYQPFSLEWNEAIVAKYFETLDYASQVTGLFPSARCGKTQFIAFYQPYQVDPQFADGHAAIRKRIANTPFMADVSDALDGLGKSVYSDGVHIHQAGNERMGKVLAEAIVRRGTLAGCQS